MNDELKVVYDMLRHATSPEDVFGDLSAATSIEDKLEAAKKMYRKIAMTAHPDKYLEDGDKKIAQVTFTLLQPLWEQAQRKISLGTYGDTTKEAPSDVHVTSKKLDVTIGSILTKSGAMTDLHSCTFTHNGATVMGALKLARKGDNNVFVENEATYLEALHKTDSELKDLIPMYYDSLTNDGLAGNVLSYDPKLVSIEQVINAYPNGIDPKDMCWMWKRTLAAIWFAHQNQIIHGGVIPPHILLNLETHAIVLVDWTNSVRGNGTIKAIHSAYEDYYPPEVFIKKAPTPATDIYMSAMTMIRVLGGDVAKKEIPSSVPKEIRSILRACTLRSLALEDARYIHQEFDTVIKRLWGPSKFRNFQLPK